MGATPGRTAWPDVAGVPDLVSGPRWVDALALCLVLPGVGLIVALVLGTGSGLVPVALFWGRIAPLVHQAFPGPDAAGPVLQLTP
jgi:hypothetical protein